MKVNTAVVPLSESLTFDALVMVPGVADRTITLQMSSESGQNYTVLLTADTVTELLEACTGVGSAE